MTDREKGAAKNIERVLASMTPDEKDKILILSKVWHSKHLLTAPTKEEKLNERTYQHHL